MKTKRFKLTITAALVLFASCNEPETVVTDIVHADGSITRRIEMKYIEKKIKIPDIQVPFDSTWSVRDSLEINDKGDTLWVKRADKLFRNTDEINLNYEADSSYNKEISRRAIFSKKFRWFHTYYRFAEQIDKKITNGYPVSDFLDKEELDWFYSPDNVKEKKKNGPDSLKYQALDDSVTKRTDLWTIKSVVSELISEFGKLTKARADGEMSARSLKSREDEITNYVMGKEDKFDSLWTNGVVLKKFLGEANALKFRTDADSALGTVIERFLMNFKQYTVRIAMPGKVAGSNGFIDSTRLLLWPVKSDYFLTQPYEMWAESKVPNRWAWIVSGLFVIFVFTGVILTKKGKG